MKQALHIFQKDVRRLWIQIALLMVALGYFAWLDGHLSAIETTNSIGTLVIECIAGAMVWFLIARAVHEESLPGENQFWLTRPYERASLLGAKILLILVVVIVPFFVADCFILGGQSLPVGENLGGLLLRQLLTATWLVLPPFAIASITRSITEDVMVWIPGLAIAAMFYFPATALWFRDEAEMYWIAIAIVLMIVVLLWQYLRRSVAVSRTIMAVAVLLPVQPAPQSAAAAIDGIRNDPATSEISIAVKPGVVHGTTTQFGAACASIPVAMNGIRPGWRVMVLSEKDTFTAEDGGRQSVGWQPRGGDLNVADLQSCLAPVALRELGGGKKLAIHASLIVGVYADDGVLDIKATYAPFAVPGVGRCQFQPYYLGNYAMVCEAPVRAPAQGRVLIDTLGTAISSNLHPAAPMGMLAGMSPVYKWVTASMNNQIREAVQTGGAVEFRPESRIAVLEREIEVKDVEF